MKRPIIGITSDYSDGYDDRYPHLLTYRIKSTYTDAVIKSGGTPLIIPFNKAIDVDDIIDRLDAIIISGSRDDIHPYFIDQHGKLPKRNFIERQDFEFRIASSAIDRGKPVLGICGGMQLINVLFGGNLIEDIPTALGSDIHRQGYFKIAHRIRIDKSSHLYRATKKTVMGVNSTHHQAVYSIPHCFGISATSEDGVVEGIELDADSLVIGVQFHPEALLNRYEHLSIFKYFIKKARER